MPVTQILDPSSGEGLIGIEPPILQQGNAGWLQRLSLFTGRTLSDTALDKEQAYRAGRLNLLGQAVTQGVVQGLDLSVDLTAKDPILSVAPGYGITATGQDVTLLRTMKTTLSGLAVIDGTSGLYVSDFGKYVPPAAVQPWAGIIALQAVVTSMPGSVIDNTATSVIVSGNEAASCGADPSEDSYSDIQLVDAARLVFITWPAAVAMPSAAPSTTWRNRLAHAVFTAELALASDSRLAWEYLAVPLALAGLDAASTLLFADRSSVVRTGGLPRRRYLLPYLDAQQNLLTVQPALANARVSQFAEQLGEDLNASSPPGLVPNEFLNLPPVGILPAFTVDFVNKVALWCPSFWNVTAAPVYTEEMEGILQGGMTAAPLTTSRSETIEILVPLPDAVYDPEILVTEIVAPVFQQEVDAATDVRNGVLKHRKAIQLEANALAAVAAQPVIDIDAGLTSEELKGRDSQPLFTPAPTETFATTLTAGAFVSTDLQQLQTTAGNAPYAVTAGAATVPFFSIADWADLKSYGLQHFIDRINAKLDRANDLLDLAFLTVQTDIYRYRQNVLQTTDATRLAVSPILANIASGITATATAQNITDYLASIHTSTPAPAPTTSPAPKQTPAAVAARSVFRASILNTRPLPPNFTGLSAELPVTAGVRTNRTLPVVPKTFTPITSRAGGGTASTGDVTGQSPIVGAQMNLRTLTIAERLALPPSQEALFYSVANRVAFLQLLADLDLTIDDLPILLDMPTGTTPPATPLMMGDLRAGADPVRKALVWSTVNNPQIDTPVMSGNPDEGEVFSVGVHVLEQHTQMMRAVEARIQTYRDFLTLCANALANIQNNLGTAQGLLTQLGNDLTQARQNVAFVSALLADESARVAGVNASRTNILQTYVKYVAFHRPRTVVNQPSVPARQLVPTNVASPVPACLQQSLVIPPELREIVSLLREAPVRWFPPILSQLANLERPALLQGLAYDTRARAAMLLKMPLQTSSAAASPGVYAREILSRYSSNQQLFRGYQVQRSAFQPLTIATQSWSAQVDYLGGIVAVGDLQSSQWVHAEIWNAVALSLRQISNVATCLYTRVGQTPPIDRLAWAQFLLGSPSISLRSLANLPGWNSQDYTDRQQMQLLVDWLFQQVNATDGNAAAAMNDVVAVAILLASDAPVDRIIAGAVAAQTTPVIGRPIRLTLPSDRVSRGMYVDLYSTGKIAARAMVTDLDNIGVTATVTHVYTENVTLAVNDVAHYSAQSPEAVVHKAFS